MPVLQTQQLRYLSCRQLRAELKERNISSSVKVIGATNMPDSIDPAFRHDCRFETEFAIGMPDENARFKILQFLCRKLKLRVDLHWIAHHTVGYLGADLERLVEQSVRIGVRRISVYKYRASQGLDPISDSSTNYLDAVLEWFKSKWKVPEEELEHLYFELQDFQDALRRHIPYSEKEGFATVPDVTWEELQKAILDRNMLNLYKAEIPSHPESSAKSNFPTPDDDKLVKNDGTVEVKKNSNSASSSSLQSSKSAGEKSPVFTLKDSTLTFKDVEELDEVLSCVLMRLKHPEVLAHLGISPTEWFLDGPPGCDKTHSARPIAGDRNMLNLYKAEIPSHPESSGKSNFPTPDDDKLVQNDGTVEVKKNSNSVSSSSLQSSKSAGEKSPVFTLKDSTLTFKDVGGLDEVLSDVLDLFLPLRYPEVFANLGISPTEGFLLHGPPGCGKTLLARAIAGELGLPYFEVAATELVCGMYGESESIIQDLFNEAFKNAPCILFLDEIDAICPKREVAERGMETQLLKCLDELKERNISSSVKVIGATNRPDSIDRALRHRCHFETEFAIGMPDENDRFKILQVLCRKLKLRFDLHWVANHTVGYLGTDLNRLVARTVRKVVRRISFNKYREAQGLDPISDSSENYLDAVSAFFKSSWKLPKEEYENLYFELKDFQDALRVCVPYSKREGFAAGSNAVILG